MKGKNKKMADFPKFYGKVPIGTKGQIVIPAEARKTMGISPGDSLIIISGPPHQQKMMSIMPEEEFNKFLSFFEEHLSKLKTAAAK